MSCLHHLVLFMRLQQKAVILIYTYNRMNKKISRFFIIILNTIKMFFV
jgi:hypothetical protein